MMQALLKTGVVLILAATFVSCDKIKPPLPELQKPPAVSDQVAQQGQERKAFAQTAEKELDEIRAAIADFRAKSAAANAQTKARLGEEIDELEGEWREAQKRLLALKSATLESWKEMKDSFGKSLDKLKAKMKDFRKEST